MEHELIDFFNKRTTNQFIDYQDYINYQVKYGLSFENENEKWCKGQQICIENKFKNLNKNLRILDICCGDGRGLQKFKDLGFLDVTGVEISDDKIKLANQFNYKIIKRDICLGPFDFGEKYDIIYSSHTIEHVLNPLFTIKNIMNNLKPDGKFFLVLPYPDIEASNPQSDHRFKVHCGVVPLGLHINDNGKTLCKNIEEIGYNVVNVEFENFREPEIHLTIIN
jgi:SAM-dependent methyltransferase